MEAVKALELIQADAEAIANDKPQRFSEAASPGDYFRQGDIYVTLLDKLPDGCEAIEIAMQLAEGNTQGSRHILDSRDGVAMYRILRSDALTGPVLKCDQERTITHPEHGDVVLPPGVYGITYQRAFADELRRVVD